MTSADLRGVWRPALQAHEFEAHGAGWRRGEMTVGLAGGWLVFERPAHEQNPLESDASWPGLWRLVPRAAGLVCALELPPALVAQVDDSPEERETAMETIDWALAGAAGEPLEAPVSAEGATPADPSWVVHSGSALAQVHALHGDARAGLELRLASRPPLDPVRADWTRRVLLDARLRWRLVRALLVDGLPTLRVDLRGAPAAIAAPLVGAALDAVRQVGMRLLEPLDLLLDPELDSRALVAGGFDPARSSPRARPASKRRARPVVQRD